MIDIIEQAMKVCPAEWGEGVVSKRLGVSGPHWYKWAKIDEVWEPQGIVADNFEAHAYMESVWLAKLAEDGRTWKLGRQRLTCKYDMWVWSADGFRLLASARAPTRIEAIAKTVVEVFGKDNVSA